MADGETRDEWRQFAGDQPGRWLLHLPTGTVGKVAKVYAPGEYGYPKPRPADAVGHDVAFADDLTPKVREAVLQFEDGNAFLARPENFQPLTDSEVLVFAAVTEGLAAFMVQTLKVALADQGRTGISLDSAVAVTRAALLNQLRALERR